MAFNLTREQRKASAHMGANARWGKPEQETEWAKQARKINDALAKKYAKQTQQRGIRRELQC